ADDSGFRSVFMSRGVLGTGEGSQPLRLEWNEFLFFGSFLPLQEITFLVSPLFCPGDASCPARLKPHGRDPHRRRRSARIGWRSSSACSSSCSRSPASSAPTCSAG